MARKPKTETTKDKDDFDRSAVPDNVNPTRENAEHFEKEREKARKESEQEAKEVDDNKS